MAEENEQNAQEEPLTDAATADAAQETAGAAQEGTPAEPVKVGPKGAYFLKQFGEQDLAIEPATPAAAARREFAAALDGFLQRNHGDGKAVLLDGAGLAKAVMNAGEDTFTPDFWHGLIAKMNADEDPDETTIETIIRARQHDTEFVTAITDVALQMLRQGKIGGKQMKKIPFRERLRLMRMLGGAVLK